MSSPTITLVDEPLLVNAIAAARRRLLFMAPGVSLRVAKAVADTWRRLPAATSVILDVSPEVCRLGYGELAGLQLLQETARQLGGTLCHQPGVRIALLISDDATWVFTPTPLLVEAPSNSPSHPNGVSIGAPPPA